MHPLTGDIWETEHGPRGEMNSIGFAPASVWLASDYLWDELRWHAMDDKTHMEGMEQPVHYWLPSIATAGIDFYEGDAFQGEIQPSSNWHVGRRNTAYRYRDKKVVHIETI